MGQNAHMDINTYSVAESYPAIGGKLVRVEVPAGMREWKMGHSKADCNACLTLHI